MNFRYFYFVGILSVGLVLLVANASAKQFSDDDIEKARLAAQQGKQAYWDCLSAFLPKATKAGLSGEEYKQFLKGVCLSEKQTFKVPFVDYVAMKFPQVDQSKIFESFEDVSNQAIDSEVAKLIGQKMQ